MGLFDFLSRKKQAEQPAKTKGDRELARLARLVENKLSQNYDRQEAIETLSRMATAASAVVLLKRFNWSMDPSITDQDEKEAAAKGIAAAGEEALGPIREYCQRAQSLTWAMKVLKDIVPEDRYAEELLTLLDQFDTEYTRNPERKIQLIDELKSYPSDEVRVAIEPFLNDMSEPVRFTAVHSVLSTDDPASVPALVAALEEEESLRVKNRIAHGLAERGWLIAEEQREACAKALPPGFRVHDGKVVQV